MLIAMSDETVPEFDPADLQWALMAVRDAWSDHDERALASLTDEQVEQQVEARQSLLQLVAEYRESAKLVDEQAVYHAPEWQVVAGLVDLFERMAWTAVDARDARSVDR